MGITPDIPAVIWLKGLPCSGKSTIGGGIYRILKDMWCPAEHLDGDEIRKIFP
jgi:adenylylsulfate kinase